MKKLMGRFRVNAKNLSDVRAGDILSLPDLVLAAWFLRRGIAEEERDESQGAVDG